jgi:hypothetical protein
MANDLTYFEYRESQEKTAALRATHPRARQAHVAMAQEYEELIRSLTATATATAPKLETLDA